MLIPAAATAADRVALVVGMSDYKHIPALDNTLNDARGLAETLEDIDFDVTLALDTPLAELSGILGDFAFKAETSELALVYFAGHGVEVQGENFLIPIDANVQSNADVQRQSVSLDQLLATVERARKMRIVILDSCRDNPLGDLIDLTSADTDGTAEASGGGLAPASPDRGLLVAYAAKDGQVALDGSGDNSPYATALMERLPEPGLEISLMFRQVRDMVLQTTGNRQEPHTYGSLSGVPFYLAGAAEGQEDVIAEDRSVAWSTLRPEQEEQLLALADTGDTRSMLGLAYMRLNPNVNTFDPESAVGYLTRAAEAGAPEAQFELAKLYERGIGVEPDPARALELYRAAAEQDFADAINDLGFFHHQGSLGLIPDPQRALTFFERAADLRHPQAQFNFAALIDDGLIPSKGPEDAAGYLYQALRSGSIDVLNLLTERPTMFKTETRRALQAELQTHGFYDGGLDGQIGPGSITAIRRAFGLEG
ncbi:caspase family protein [Aliiroseovarius sp. YM-037]|uniref:caspase family protein n=1 Tax=Aliiroseovarius sp. YM-037 TaxID=3341728 RepID=UPI003A8011B4